jgi:hypothetical protein
MRNVSKPGGESDFRNCFVPAVVIKKLTGTIENPFVVNVFSDRTIRGGK